METLILLLGLLFFGAYKKDFTSLIFAGLGFILYGLELYPFNVGFGAIAIGFGVYVAVRAGLDLITYKKEVEYG